MIIYDIRTRTATNRTLKAPSLRLTSRFEKLTTVTNILLLNLVVSSLVFMSSLPLMAAYMQRSDWIFGAAMCKIYGSVYYLGFYSSVLFLALLTFDRHLAVVYSLDALRVRSMRYAVISCVVVWLVSGLMCIKQMVVHTAFVHNVNNRTYCEEFPGKIETPWLRDLGFYLQMFLFLLFPLGVITYCYVRITITVITSKLVSKFKTVRLIFIIVVMFFLCWIPFNVVMLMHGDFGTCKQQQKWSYALQVTRVLAYFYFCVSPMFYTLVGRKFQNYFRQMLVKRFPRLRRHISVNHSGTNGSTRTTPNDPNNGL